MMLTAFEMIFLWVLGDKTQLVTFAFAVERKSKLESIASKTCEVVYCSYRYLNAYLTYFGQTAPYFNHRTRLV
jgi:putative Ca2+/H+ antiporter (TMEM165/GDT1 family)